MVHPFKRCLYLCNINIQRTEVLQPNGTTHIDMKPTYTIKPSDVNENDEQHILVSHISPDDAYRQLLNRIEQMYTTLRRENDLGLQMLCKYRLQKTDRVLEKNDGKQMSPESIDYNNNNNKNSTSKKRNQGYRKPFKRIPFII